MDSLYVLTLAAFLTHAALAEAPDNAFLKFISVQASDLRAGERPPDSLGDWERQRNILRAHLLRAWGGFPEEPCPLRPRILGTLQRDGYRIERLIFQTMPDVWMTANAYVPDQPGALPAVLCVHGHWPGAKQDPHVQARSVGLAKLGFFVLTVDAFGAGERGVGKALGEYHGEMVAATLCPVGRSLSGLQVYENMRAVDYMLTRPEVDGARLGITGASGGGNQTMYAGAWDKRFKAVVPVCSVGNYQAYLGAACCMCEVVPGALQFSEEWAVLALTAPRALMIISATEDAHQFSVAEARKSLASAKAVYLLHDRSENLRHATFEAGHGYNQAMRETMYGWMTRHLKGEGDGLPIPEPSMELADPETLRCFPGETRPDDWITTPRFAAREGRRLRQEAQAPTSADAWRKMARVMRVRLDREVLGGTKPAAIPIHSVPSSSVETIVFEVEPGIRLRLARHRPKVPQESGTVLLLNLRGEAAPPADELASALVASGKSVLSLALRATGAHAYPRDTIGRAPDHNTAEWSLWLGRPLLGQWVMDIRAALDTLEAMGDMPNDLSVVGVGTAGVAALCAAALDPRLERAATVGALASYISDVPYEGQSLGIMAPGIVRDVGDMARLAALLAPRKLIIAGGVHGGGHALGHSALKEHFRFTKQVYNLEGVASAFRVLPSADTEGLIEALAQ